MKNHFLYDTNEKDNLNLYFSSKNKHGFSLNKEEKEMLMGKINNYVETIDNYDFIIYPESSKPFIEDIISCFKNGKKIKFNKNSKEYILKRVLEEKMSKLEKESQKNRIEKMSSNFEINKIKMNQRKRYIPYLFQTYPLMYHYEEILNENIDTKFLIVDDSIFSSSTITALKSASGVFKDYDTFSVFYEV